MACSRNKTGLAVCLGSPWMHVTRRQPCLVPHRSRRFKPAGGWIYPSRLLGGSGFIRWLILAWHGEFHSYILKCGTLASVHAPPKFPETWLAYICWWVLRTEYSMEHKFCSYLPLVHIYCSSKDTGLSVLWTCSANQLSSICWHLLLTVICTADFFIKVL